MAVLLRTPPESLKHDAVSSSSSYRHILSYRRWMLDRSNLGVSDSPDGSRTVVNKNVGHFILDALSALREEKKMCDVVLKVEGEEIVAHRIILLIHSSYFHAMFAEGFSESAACEVPIPGEMVTWSAAKLLIDFMYTGKLTVTPATVQGLIMTADHWQVTTIRDLCVDYMEQLIDPLNCLGVLSFAEVYDYNALGQKSKQVLKQRFPVVCTSQEFVQQTSSRIKEILSFSDLALGPEGEDVVLKALLRWAEYDPEVRVNDLPVLLRKVRLEGTSPEYRRELIESNLLVHSNKEILGQLKQGVGVNKEVRSAPSTHYVIGGFRTYQTGPKGSRLRNVERLDSLTNKWTPCADFPMLSSNAFAFSVHGQLVCCACQTVAAVSRDVIATQTTIYEYSPIYDKWLDARDMFSLDVVECLDSCLQTEGTVAVCLKTNTIYAVSHSEVCRISPSLLGSSVHFRSVQLLPRPPAQFFSSQHRWHSAVVVEERLYVLGGDLHNAGTDPVPTATVLMWDPNTNTWLCRASMTEPRAKMAVAQLDGKIYACGGFNVRRLTSMERYDPATDTWTPVRSMHRFRTHHHLFVHNKKIIAIGGKSQAVGEGGAKEVVGACEEYHPDRNRWFEGPPMKAVRCGFAAATL